MIKNKIYIQAKRHSLCLSIAALILSCTVVRGQIVLNYRNHLVPPDIIYTYQGANGGVTVPTTGANQIWDYSSLVNAGLSISQPYIPETNPAFNGNRRQQIFNEHFGAGFFANTYLHQKDNGSRLSTTGASVNRSAYSLFSITGNINDSIILLSQNIFYNGNKLTIPYPVHYLTGWLCNYNYVVNLQISLAAEGLNHAPLKYTTKVDIIHNVTGWGDMRIPTVAGPGDFTPCLLLKSFSTRVDSFFVNNAPASNAVLNVLGFNQAQTTYQFLYHFKRVGLDQDLATFYFTDSSYSTIDKVIYDRTHYDLYCSNDICHAKMCLNGNTVCLPYSNNAANTAMLLNHAHLGECEPNRIANQNYVNENHAQLYPNPSGNQFTLLLNDDGETPATVTVYDYCGRKVKQLEEINGIIVFGNDLLPGVYFTCVETGAQKQIFKMIKTE